VPVDRDLSVVGCVGVLTLGTRGSEGPGEVLVKIRGGSETLLAWSDEPLPRGESVLIVDLRGPRTVDVVAWSDPLGTDG
jgi:hypothetical protein